MTELRATETDPQVERALETIHDRADEVRREETAQALSRLRDCRSLDEQETEAVRTLAARLTARLIATPTAALREGDRSQADVAMDIFGQEE